MNDWGQDILDMIQRDLPRAAPEVVVVVAMCAVLAAPFLKSSARAVRAAASAGIVIAIGATLWTLRPMTLLGGDTLFAGLMAIDPFSQVVKLILLGFTLLVLWQAAVFRPADMDDSDTPDYVCLLLGALFGMMLMASANSLLMIVVAMESASLPSFALAGFRKRHRLSTEAALKYVLFGAVSSAVMIYGASLVYGGTGSLELGAIGTAASTNMQPMLALGLAALLAGFAFKLSAAPMHFWCPDVFQGAPIEITTFLSVASKGAAVCMLVRLLAAIGDAGGSFEVFLGVAVLGVVTATWGNVVAFHQTSMRRLLAYSSIAHAGYMVMAASLLAIGAYPDEVAAAILFYLVVYAFMNLGGFTLVGQMQLQHPHSSGHNAARGHADNQPAYAGDDIRTYTGMMRSTPAPALLLAIFLLSLFGMPTLGGFVGKIYLARVMVEAGPYGVALMAALFINTLISLYYYLRPVYYMAFKQATQTESSPTPASPTAFRLASPAGVVLLLCMVMIFITGLLPESTFSLLRNHSRVRRAAIPIVDRTPANSATTPTRNTYEIPSAIHPTDAANESSSTTHSPAVLPRSTMQ